MDHHAYFHVFQAAARSNEMIVTGGPTSFTAWSSVEISDASKNPIEQR
jgi:hypothetical protein